MEILLTNDDGIFAPGIRALTHELCKIGNVTVLAPDREQSATGHAITVHHPLRVQEMEFGDGSCAKAYSVDGTPSDCVKLGAEVVLKKKPALVVSGINRGPNLGTDVLYSGTVSAALEGVILGIPSIAVSLATVEEADYAFAAKFTRIASINIVTRGLPPDTLLNINIPSLEEKDIAGVQITRLGIRRYKDVFDRRTDPRGKVYYWLAGEVIDLDEDPDTDTVAIRNNLISVTPIHFDLTKYALIQELENWTWPLEN